jgi:DNA invertase Pin-like site-specific DNA recombinase
MGPMVKKDSKKAIGYIRCSTKRQGISGLGLDAQRQAIAEFCAQRGLRVLCEFVDVESGKNDDRAELQKALAKCKATGSLLVIARLDRLARKVSFVSALMDSAVEFTCADFPEANRLTLHILAAVAEYESRLISIRTSAALQAAIRRGTVLGNDNLTRRGRLKGLRNSISSRQRLAAERHQELLPSIRRFRAQGNSLWETTELMQDEGYTVSFATVARLARISA